MEFRERLRRAIARAGLSQAKTAKLLDISASTLESWLAAPDKPWARKPHPLMQTGALLRLNAVRHQAAHRERKGLPPERKGHGSRRKFDHEVAARMHTAGVPIREIAAAFHVSYQAVNYALRNRK